MANPLSIIVHHKKVLLSSSIGTIMEWYDFFIFGILAKVISTHFFPADNPDASFLYTLMAFAISFLVRPLGAIIFGYIGDRFGRKPSLMISILLMGVCSMGIGCVPAYEHIGVWSSLCIIILRILQGIAIGGEYTGAGIFLAESTPPSHRSLITSFIQTTSSFGFIFSLLITISLREILGTPAFEEWGWRIAFLVSLLFIFPSYYIRKNLFETPLFQAIKAKKEITKNPLKTLFTTPKYIRTLVICIVGVTIGQGITSYVGFYPLYFLSGYHTIPAEHIDVVMLISSALLTPIIIFWGYIGDKVNYKWMIIIGMLLCLISYFPAFHAMHHLAKDYPKDASVFNKNSLLIMLWICVMKICFTIPYAPLIAILVSMFPVSIRYSGISIAYNIGNGIFGGTYPVVATYLSLHPIWLSPHLAHLLYPLVLVSISIAVSVRYLPSSNTAKQVDNTKF